MSFFCFLWVPLFYFFRRSFSPGCGAGAVWALILGSIFAFFQFFFGSLVNPGGFGFSRWLYGFVDIVSLPILLPFLLYWILVSLKLISDKTDFANFALLWIIPTAALRALSWSFLRDPVLLVFVPLMWTALAVGIQLFMDFITEYMRWYVILFSVLCIFLLPLGAAAAYWAFFSQQNMMGYMISGAVIIPLLFSVVIAFLRAKEAAAPRQQPLD